MCKPGDEQRCDYQVAHDIAEPPGEPKRVVLVAGRKAGKAQARGAHSGADGSAQSIWNYGQNNGLNLEQVQPTR